LAAKAAVPVLEIAPRERAPALGKRLQVRQLAESDARGDVGEVELAPRYLDFHAVLAAAHHTLQAQRFAERHQPLVRQHQRAAFGAGDVLVRVEAERDEVAEAADRLSAPARAEGLGGILDHPQML